jgi:hypothetical protein
MLICVGLSGCVFHQDDGITYIEDLIENPDEYIGKNVTLKGHYSGPYYLDNSLIVIVDFGGGIPAYAPENVDTSNIIRYEDYLWSGVIESYKDWVRINLTNIKPI